MSKGLVRLFSISFLLLSCGRIENDRSRILEFSEYQLHGTDLPDKTVSLTFDDGPSERTVELGKYLAENNISATFFVVGEMAAIRRESLAKLKAQGHLVANHSYSHPQLPKINDATAIAEVRRTDAIIAPFVTANMYLFRAPYAAWSGHLANILNDAGLQKYIGSIRWEVGSRVTARYSADWECWQKKISVENCGQGYLNEIADNKKGIVLLHDLHSKTVDMVKWLVPQLQKGGYRFAALDEIPNIAAATRAAGGTPRY